MTQPRQRVGIAVVLTRDGTRCLVGIRSSETSLANMLEFPGGKSVPGETSRDTAIRECLEETGIAVDAIQLLEHRSHDYDHGRVALDFWLCHARGDQDPRRPAEVSVAYVVSGRLYYLCLCGGVVVLCVGLPRQIAAVLFPLRL